MKVFVTVFYVLCVTFTLKAAKNDDDEGRPYEFGFTIDGQQHRHEKKDVNGIIQGEFGFITADGVYHVTVYATDENGNFRILSMRNVRISAPLDGSGTPEQRSFSPQSGIQPQQPQQQALSTTPRGPYRFTTQSTIKPACAGCGYVTTSKTPVKNIFPAYNQQQNGGIPFPQGPPQLQQNNPPQITSRITAEDEYNEVSPARTPEGGFNQPSKNPFAPPAYNPNQPQTGVPLQSQGQLPINGQSPEFPSGEQENVLPKSPQVQPGFPVAPQGFTGRQGKELLPGQGFVESQFQGENPYSGIEPGSLDTPKTRLSQVSVSDGVIKVPGNPDIPIRDKYPGMVDGLPNGIEEKDVTDLLYKFNYTVGFHGHYEKGFKNGAKIGGYFVNGRDGLSRVVTYVADENGFRPKFKLIRLGLDSPDTPKEETEKTFGLKNFEFIWYPIG